MNIINKYITNLQPYIIIGMVIIILILFILLIVAFKSLSKLEKRYRKFTRGVDNKNIEQIVEMYFERIEQSKATVDELDEKFKSLDVRMKNCIQKTSIVRYKAFEDIGSDLSFSIALLDDYNNGVLLTGIYNREDSVVYAKPIDRGISRYDLSEEEEGVLNKAIGEKK